MKVLPQITHQQQQIVATLVLTGILSLGAAMTLVNSAAAESVKSPQGFANLKQSSDLPVSVINAISRDISRSNNIPPSQLRVVTVSQKNWTDSCLGLGKRDESCGQVFIQNGWRVTMSDGRQTWVYRADNTGRIVRLENQSNPNSSNLPSSVADAVLQAASQLTGLRTSDLRIVKSEQINTDGCLGLPRSGEFCTRINMQAWEVTVEGGRNTLVYRSTNNASQVRLNESASNIASANVPDAVSNAVLQFASGQLGVPTSRLRIVNSQQQTWQDSCLGLPRAVERCMGIVTQGWRVTVENRQQQQQQYVYRTNNTGSQVRAEDVANQPPGDNNLPSSVAKAVLEEASNQSNLSTSRLRIVKSEQREWSDGCLGLPDRGRLCTQSLVSGWRVTVEGDRQTYIYRTNASGSLVKLENGTTAGSGDAVRMSSRELPPPLGQGVVFRAIATGGIVGNTIETVLMNDGQVIRRFNNSRIKNPVQTHQISRQELRQFLQLLDKERFSQFNQLSYPAPRGSADTISVTLSSQSGTTRFTDASSDRLPDNLKSVIQAWSQIANRR